MNKKAAKQFRDSRANELRRLAQILQDAGLVSDVGALHSAASQCQTYEGLVWGYDLTALRFEFVGSDLQNTKPAAAQLEAVELDVALKGPCLDDGAEDDPFTKLHVDVVITGLDREGGSLITAWHLDKHERGESEFHHPEYHFHYGGKRVWDYQASRPDFGYGSLLLLESPRLEHKPLDGILAVDFVLGNFFGPSWKALKAGDGRYQELIRTAEKRCHFAHVQALHKRLGG